MVRGLCQSSCVKHFSIIHGLNFFFCSGFILQLKWVGNFVDLFAGDSSSPDSFWIALLRPTFSFVNRLVCSFIFSAYFCLFTWGCGVTILIAIV